MLDRTDLIATAVRFIGAGLVNTLLTFLIFQGCLFLFSPLVSYSLSWIVGLIFVTTFYPSHVFKMDHPTWSKKLIFLTVYLLIFFAGGIALDVLTRNNIHPRLAIVIVIVFTTLINFLAGRTLFPAEEK